MTSLRTNILANYASQIYVTLLGIVMVPLYLRFLGAEAYGLVAFFSMLQAWFNLLDLGLTPTMSREAARFRAGGVEPSEFRGLVRGLEGVFLAIALVGGLALLALARPLGEAWLKVERLPLDEVLFALRLMAPVVALRWMGGVYRGAVGGFERLAGLGIFNSAVATLRFVGVLPALLAWGATTSVFFTYQLAVAALELAGLVLYTYRLLPAVPREGPRPVPGAALRRALAFSLTIALPAAAWVGVTQTDKLILSKLLPLAQYGEFALAVLVAGGVMILGGPISGAIMPRMAKLEAEGDSAGVIRVYRQSTQLVAVLCGAASVLLAVFAEPVLRTWTGDVALARRLAPVLALYAAGNGVVSVCAFPYYLQFAKGDLRIHMVCTGIFVAVLMPALVWAASRYGALGAGWVWLGMNALTFVAWVPVVHRKFEPGLNAPWYLQDTLAIFASAALAGGLLRAVLPDVDGRWAQGALLVLAGGVVLAAAAAASSAVRARCFRSAG